MDEDTDLDDISLTPPEPVDIDRKPKNDQKSKSNDATRRVRVMQGRWRTVLTQKVPRSELKQPSEEHVEHRPLGF